MNTIERQDIQYLQHLYAKATDIIGTGADQGVAEGRAIYQRIFTEDAWLRAVPQEGEQLVRQGPEGWLEVVVEALAPYSSTQHLIGTQIVDILRIDLDGTGNIAGGEARMESYLQAWHENKPAGTLWLFLGTYDSKVRYTLGAGWQIYDMTLRQVAGENRALGTV